MSIHLSISNDDSALRIDKNYCPQVYLEKYKYVFFKKKKKIFNYINDDLNVSSDDSDVKDSDYSDEENSKK